MTGSEDAPGDGNGTGDRGRGRLNSQRDLWWLGRSRRIAPIYPRSCFISRRHAAGMISLDRAARPLTTRHCGATARRAAMNAAAGYSPERVKAERFGET